MPSGKPKPARAGNAFRIERDPLGELRVPAGAYYGVQTRRAIENFAISGLTAPPELVVATILVKKAAARANAALGRLPADIANAIVAAADEVLAGSFRDQFVVDVYQAGAGTSHNMNANEVLANRASEILGGRLGEYTLRAPQRSRQHGAVDERRVSHRDASRAPPDAAGPPAERARPRRWTAREERRVRARAEDGTHAPAGRGADHCWTGARRLCRQHRACSDGGGARVGGTPRVESWSDSRRDGTECRNRLHDHGNPGSGGADGASACGRRPIDSV